MANRRPVAPQGRKNATCVNGELLLLMLRVQETKLNLLQAAVGSQIAQGVHLHPGGADLLQGRRTLRDLQPKTEAGVCPHLARGQHQMSLIATRTIGG